jgi:hypothetical protein
MFDYRLEHIMSYNATLAAPEIIGPLPEGLRVNFYVTGGEVTGPRVFGKVRPVGADWLTLRKDGVGLLDVRATIETNDGALIYVTYPGIIDLGENGYQDFLEGRPPASGTPIRTSPRCMTSHPNYAWLNRLHCVGIGQAFIERLEVAYDVYAVR